MAAKSITVETHVPIKTVRGLLVSAFEGGSNYWYVIDSYQLGGGYKFADFKEGGKAQPKDDYFHWSQLIPTVKGCALIIEAGEEYSGSEAKRLDLDAIKKGLSIMPEKYPRHWADVLAENDDATTGDVFLQCCLFGECFFG